MMKLNYGKDFTFQENNSPVHKAWEVKNFLKSFQIKFLDWPNKSPDLNIAKDVWKLLSDSIYDGPSNKSKAFLVERMKEAIMNINEKINI